MRNPSAPTPTIGQSYSSDDPLQVREFLDQAYGAVLDVGVPDDGGWRMASRTLAAGPITAIDVDLPLVATVELSGGPQWVFCTVLDGVNQYGREQSGERFGRGDLYVAAGPDDTRQIRGDHVHALTFSLPHSLLADVAPHDADRPDRPFRFTSMRPVTDGARQWLTASRMVQEIISDPKVAGAELIIGPAARLLAATALAVFPNSAVDPGSLSAPGPRAHPGTLRRAIAFIDANPQRDITLADIARAAHVTPRAIQLAFRRHLDTTPTGYLRQVRLHHAHRTLLDATPEQSLTVTRIAIDWGFANPSRFAAHYRAAYGRSPSQTLST